MSNVNYPWNGYSRQADILSSHKDDCRLPCWWLSNEEGKLRYGDGRIAVVGETHEINLAPMASYMGLHASVFLWDAARSVSGFPHAKLETLWRVELGGQIDHRHDEIGTGLWRSAATKRRYVSRYANGLHVAQRLSLVAVLEELEKHPLIVQCRSGSVHEQRLFGVVSGLKNVLTSYMDTKPAVNGLAVPHWHNYNAFTWAGILKEWIAHPGHKEGFDIATQGFWGCLSAIFGDLREVYTEPIVQNNRMLEPLAYRLTHILQLVANAWGFPEYASMGETYHFKVLDNAVEVFGGPDESFARLVKENLERLALARFAV